MAIQWGKGKWYDWPAGGIWDEIFGGKEAETNPYGSLNPEHKLIQPFVVRSLATHPTLDLFSLCHMSPDPLHQH